MQHTIAAPRSPNVAAGADRRRHPVPPILSYGFRPFFLAAGLWAVLSMLLWIGALLWGWTPGGGYGVVHWHGHEMLFGYAVAALAGFMLTAIPNWTGRLPVAGRPLLLLVLLWTAGRLAMAAPGTVGLPIAVAVDFAFLPVLGLVAAREICAGRNWNNLPILIALGLLAGANGWHHVGVLSAGDPGPSWRLAVLVLIMLIALIGGRIIVSFTRNALARWEMPHRPAAFGGFDRLALAVAFLSLGCWVVMPDGPITAGLAGTAALLHGVRLARWQGIRVVREPLLLVLHTSYGFLPIGFAAIAASAAGAIAPAAALHLLGVGAIGTMTLAVMTRASLGHTGRPLTANPPTKLAFVALALSALVRPAAEILPGGYMPMLAVSAVLWLSAFGLFLAAYGPMLATRRLT